MPYTGLFVIFCLASIVVWFIELTDHFDEFQRDEKNLFHDLIVLGERNGNDLPSIRDQVQNAILWYRFVIIEEHENYFVVRHLGIVDPVGFALPFYILSVGTLGIFYIVQRFLIMNGKLFIMFPWISKFWGITGYPYQPFKISFEQIEDFADREKLGTRL